jgi:long-chain acyl-CoA synthetase
VRNHLATLLDDYRGHADDIAVVRYHGNRRRVSTYGQIASLAGRFAELLTRRGIRQGDRVLIWGENSAEWIGAFHGCMLRGVLAVPLDASGSADFAARVAADVNPALSVGDLALVSRLPNGIPRIAFEDWPSALPAREARPIPDLSSDTPLQILFTSGTTGEPKGIVLTHGNVLASFAPIEQGAQPYLRYERLIHPLRILHTLPLSHVFGQTMGLWIPSLLCAEVHFESRLVASRLVENIRRERISVLAAVPRVHALLKTYLEAVLPGLSERFAAMEAAPKKAKALHRWWIYRDVHRALGLKFWALISGGGALPAPIEAFWNGVGLAVVQGYGMTETTALITLNHPFHVAQGTIGKPLAGREVRLGPDGEVLVRGAAISSATWSRGALHPRVSEWLATGDLAQAEATGELRFLGRKSEVIVTANGLNLHPEDLEAAIEQDPAVTACAVLPLDTANGPEPVAVLAMRDPSSQAAAVIEHANTRLAEFQRLRRWVVWPEPDLPRTSTGKVRRKVVAAGLARMQAAGRNGGGLDGHTGSVESSTNRYGNTTGLENENQANLPPKDWLLELIEQTTGEALPVGGDALLLAEDLHLDSLGRVQLEAAIEERMGAIQERTAMTSGSDLLHNAQSIGDLRRLAGVPTIGQDAVATVATLAASHFAAELPVGRTSSAQKARPFALEVGGNHHLVRLQESARTAFPRELPSKLRRNPEEEKPAPTPAGVSPATKYVYPHWPWWLPVRALRAAFLEAVLRPLVWLMAKPKIVAESWLDCNEPMLVVANHVTSFDGPLLEYALPPAIRRRMAVAMSGEMLEEYRRFRNANRGSRAASFFLAGPFIYFLLTALFNVFPLPRQRDFQRSFSHAGEALDRGMNVLLFPEGARSAEGLLAGFRSGIGLLVKQSDAPVLPMAIRGLGAMKAQGGKWFRSGMLEVRVGRPMRFSPLETAPSITAQIQAAVEKLLND